MENMEIKTFTMTIPLKLDINFTDIWVNLQNDIYDAMQDSTTVALCESDEEILDNTCDLITKEFLHWALQKLSTP